MLRAIADDEVDELGEGEHGYPASDADGEDRDDYERRLEDERVVREEG